MRLSFLALLFFLCACQNPEPEPETAVENTIAPPEENLLLPRDPTGIPLLPFTFADSSLLVPSWSSSPQGAYMVKTFAARSDDASLNNIINTALANVIAGEEAPIQTTDLRKVVVNSVKTRLLNYKKQAVDTAEMVESLLSWSLDIRYNTEVLYNANGLLTLATSYYGYTGGAHGNYYSVMHNFDLAKGAQLVYDDVLREESKAKILALLRAAEGNYEDIYPTTNIALRRDGILFNFPPYEIASYADGEIEVLLPYAKIAPFLTATGEVVARRIGGL